MRQVLTDAACKARAPFTGRIEIADLRQAGLVLRITAKGARSFAYRFRHPQSRKTLRATIGTYGPTTLEDARKRAREMAAQVAAGVSPVDARKAERESAPTRTFQALAIRYLKEHSERHKRPRSTEEDRRNLATHILPKWGKRDFRSIHRADAIELIESIVSTGKHTTANRVHTLISGIFAFAVDAELLEASPVARLRKRGKEQPRRRVLSNDEIRLLWNATTLASQPMHLALRVALLTGCRASEVTGARKTEFEHLGDSSRAKWTIPAERTKNAHAHLIPLAPLAAQTVRAAVALTAAADEFLFPGRNRKRPTSRYELPRAMQDLGRGLQDCPAAQGWRENPPVPHDLRRTTNTRLAALHIPKEVRDRCLNHISGQGDVGETHYNFYEFENEKRAALNQWAAQVVAIINPTKVIALDTSSRKRRR